MSCLRWYFVCRHCDAKWFHMKKSTTCPRCRHRSWSREQLTVPWLNEDTTRHSYGMPAIQNRNCDLRDVS